MKRFSLVYTALAVATVSAAVLPFCAHAAGNKPQVKSSAAIKPLPKYVSLATLKKLRASRVRLMQTPPPILQPLLDGESLKGKNMKDLATNPPLIIVNAKMAEVEAGADVDANNGEGAETTVNDGASDLSAAEAIGADAATVAQASMNGERFAQAFPAGGVRPAPIRRKPLRTVIPQWVRYPLEFQLCGIGLGTKAVDKDKYNRIDRYGLFAIHGNPTAVVVPTGSGNITVTQQPPEVAGLFPSSSGGGLPDWASAVTVALDNNHVQWLYRRETYSMGFVVDRLGFVDAIVVAGVYSPIAKTQLEDPIHTIQLGRDDFRKVMNRYGYPDSIETYQINTIAGAGVVTPAAAGAADAAGGAPGAAGAGAADAATNSNSVFRTFEVRYEQSYNIVFTIRDNRVVRIYIFGDPDFFNAQRRNNLRTKY